MADMKNLTQPFRTVSVLHEILWERDGIRRSDPEIRSEIINPQRRGAQARQERIAGRCAHGLIAIGPLEDHAARRQPVDVRRVDQTVPVTSEHWLQIIDADKQHIWPGELRRPCGPRETE